MKSWLAALVLLAATPLSAQYWNTTGTVNHVLRNNTFDGPQVINEVQFLTNQNTRIRILGNGQFLLFPTIGTIIGTSHQMQYATMQVQGGNFSGLASYTAQPSDWGQNIQSFVTRANTVSYVVSWNGTDRFYVAGQGWLYANGAWFSSDERLKEDIRPLHKALDQVLRLNGVTFRWREEERCADCPKETEPRIDNRTEVGLIAQDVEKVVPEVVRTLNDGTKAVAYQNLVALLIESIKTQQAQLDAQNDTIQELGKQVRKLQEGGTKK
jgi:Chaperone of endosialidase